MLEGYLLAGNKPDQAVHNTFVNSPLSPLDNQKFENEMTLLLQHYYDPNAHNDLHLSDEIALRKDWFNWYNANVAGR